MAFSQDTQNLAARIMAAVLHDEVKEGGCDISGGMMGPALSTLVDDIAFALRNDCDHFTAERFLGKPEGHDHAQ